MNDAEIRLQVKVDGSGAERSLDSLSTKATNLSKSFKDAGKKMTTMVTLPLVGLIGMGIKYNAEMEQYQAGLETLLGSSEKATKRLQELKDMAASTPFETTDLIKAEQTMLAFGLEANRTAEYMSMLGDVSMGNSDKFNSLTLAFSQVQSTGRLMGQDLLQMVNQGFNPLQIISEQTGRSMKDLKADMEKGAISAEMVSNAFKIATQEGGRFFGAMDKQSQTVNGRLSTLKDSFMVAAGELTEKLLPVFTQIVNKLIQMFNWFGSLDSGTQTMILSVIGLVAALGPALMIIGNLITLIKGVSIAMTFLAANPIVLFIAAIVAAIALLILNFKKLSPEAQKTIKNIANAFIWLLNTMTSNINKMLSLMLLPFNLLIKGLNLIPGVKIPTLKIAIPKIPMLATGTNNVERDGLAYLHQGEAVVPKKYNPAFGGSNMIQLNNVLTLDGRVVYENQQSISGNKNLQTGFGG
jgi:tape measure domain-containing protein